MDAIRSPYSHPASHKSIYICIHYRVAAEPLALLGKTNPD